MKKLPRNTKIASETSIRDGILYFEDCTQAALDTSQFTDIVGDGYTKSIRVISLDRQYFHYVHVPGTFRGGEEPTNVEMTLRREIRSGRGIWYAYRRVFGKLHKRYVGTDDAITTLRILEVAALLPSK